MDALRALPTTPGRIPAIDRRRASLFLAVTAGALTLAATVTPWVTLFAGLTPIPGLATEGGPLAGFAIAAVGVLLLAIRDGGVRGVRSAVIVLVTLVAVDAVVVARNIGAYVADPGPAAALVQPSAGPGPLVLALAAGLLALAAVLAPIGARRASRAGTRRLVLAGALFVAGWIHLLLVPGHLAESPLLGVGFLAAAAAQIALAAVVAWRPSDTTTYVVVAVNVALVAVYGWAVVVGLPLGAGHADVAGIRIGAGEPVDLAGAATKLAEIVALVLAMRRLDPTEAVPPVTGRR